MKTRILAAAALSLSVTATSAMAVDVDFTGTLTNTCSLALGTPGLMALSADGTVLGSQETGGVAATVSVLSIGASTLTIDAPTTQAAPAGYDATNETVEVAYTGASGLGGVSQAYTSALTTVPLSTIPLSVMTVNAKVTNPDSFTDGAYTVRTVVTCS